MIVFLKLITISTITIGISQKSSVRSLESTQLEDIYTIHVRIVGARLLDNLKSVDSAVELIVAGKFIGETPTKFDTFSPVWNTQFDIRGVRPNMNASLILIDRREATELGTANFTINPIKLRKGPPSMKLAIVHDKKRHGWIEIQVWGDPSADAAADALLKAPVATGPVRYTRFNSAFAGRLTGTMDDEGKYAWHTYEVQLHGIDQTMTRMFGYSERYRAIQHSPVANLVVSVMRGEHRALYRHDNDTVYGVMTGSSDFFKAINYGRRQQKAVLFTYALTDRLWSFSEGGPSNREQFLSKHIMHANMATQVAYAGEFHLRYPEDGEGAPTLVIDNNSGSYAASNDSLPELKTLLEKNFEGLKVEAVDKDEPKNKAERTSIKDLWKVQNNDREVGNVELKKAPSESKILDHWFIIPLSLILIFACFFLLLTMKDTCILLRRNSGYISL